ncbi:hypothetical protein H310_12718 [Aphanomyces invadans]|uniref:Uncharacterized protein n=1 Tax=Aphanomyces invadans TaxID=157072 RepID=A0A024TGK9_9STRA|nr:hypothetical protein H310_12718 [Aphanomyces invadans]ETV93290.1 hypothetical protein H310_12718 [Aphanomyces invadans]|eukprot:XP_008878125.1 hypothetical protein H310_12718 [Aphanomyces invadans]
MVASFAADVVQNGGVVVSRADDGATDRFSAPIWHNSYLVDAGTIRHISKTAGGGHATALAFAGYTQVQDMVALGSSPAEVTRRLEELLPQAVPIRWIRQLEAVVCPLHASYRKPHFPRIPLQLDHGSSVSVVR